MNQRPSLWGSVSVLIGVIIGITALIRGLLFLPMLLLAFLVWGAWVIVTQYMPLWQAQRSRRQQANIAQSIEDEFADADVTNLEIAQTLLRHVNYRISAYLRSCYHSALRSLVLHYQDIVELLVFQLDGRTFAQQAFHELADQCHQAAWNLYQKKPKYERKKNVIRYIGYGCQVRNWGRSDEWQLQDDTKAMLRGMAHFETGNYRTYPLGMSELLGYGYSYDNAQEFPTCEKLIQLKMFKNGRVDFKFSTEAYAEEFERLYLGSVC